MRTDVRTIRGLLWTVTGVLLCGAVLSLALLVRPVPAPQMNRANDRTAATQPSTAADPLPPLEAFEPILTMVFGEPLESDLEPVEAAPVVVAPPIRPIPLTLMGTVGDSLALLRANDGTTQIARVGDQVRDVEIVQIDTGRVRVRMDGREETLEREPEPTVGRIIGS